MNRLFKILIVIAIIVIGAGFYRGWLALTSTGGDESQKVNINLTVDGEKVQEDVAAVKQEATKLTEGVSGVNPTDENTASGIEKNP